MVIGLNGKTENTSKVSIMLQHILCRIPGLTRQEVINGIKEGRMKNLLYLPHNKSSSDTFYEVRKISDIPREIQKLILGNRDWEQDGNVELSRMWQYYSQSPFLPKLAVLGNDELQEHDMFKTKIMTADDMIKGIGDMGSPKGVHPAMWINALMRRHYNGSRGIKESLWIIPDVRYKHDYDTIEAIADLDYKIKLDHNKGKQVLWNDLDGGHLTGNYKVFEVDDMREMYLFNNGEIQAPMSECLTLEFEHESEKALDGFDDYDLVIDMSKPLDVIYETLFVFVSLAANLRE